MTLRGYNHERTMYDLRDAARLELAGRHEEATRAFLHVVERLRSISDDRKTFVLALDQLAEQMGREAERSVSTQIGLLVERAEVARTSSDYLAEAQSYCKLGSLEQRQSRMSEAVDWWHKAIAVSREHDLKPTLADALFDLGCLEEDTGNEQTSRERFADALSRYRKLGDSLGIRNAAEALTRLGKEQL